MSELFVEAGQDWIAERRAVGRTISASTEKAYRADLASWARYLEAQTGKTAALEDLTGPVIKAALAEMNGAGLSTATRRRLLTTLRGLCRYLVLESRLPADPTASIQAPRAPARLPVAFSDSQISDLLATAQAEDPQARPAAPLLDTTIVLLLAAGGLRASEAAGLKLTDYRRGEEPSVRVLGKGSKTRVVPLDAGVAEQIDAYLPWRSEHVTSNGGTDHLLVRPDGRPLTRDTISYRVNRLYARSGIPKPRA